MNQTQAIHTAPKRLYSLNALSLNGICLAHGNQIGSFVAGQRTDFVDCSARICLKKNPVKRTMVVQKSRWFRNTMTRPTWPANRAASSTVDTIGLK